MLVLLGIIAVVFAVGMVAEKDKDNRRNLTIGFVTCVAAIVMISIKC